MTQDTEETPVIFRMSPKARVRNPLTGKMEWREGELIALFPAELGTYEPGICSSYAHVGQHGSADPYYVIATTRPATPAEFADLKKELESEPYGYRLRVYSRLKPAFRNTRVAQLNNARVAQLKETK